MSEAKVSTQWHIHVCAGCRKDKYCNSGNFDNKCGVPYPYVCDECKQAEQAEGR